MLRWIVAAVCPLAVFAQSFDAAAIDAIAKDAVARSGVPGMAIAIVQDDRVVYAKGFGVRRTGSNEPVTANTVFAIGSVTKGFTAAALGTLVDEGRLSWDDPVRRHLPWFKLADPAVDSMVTLRDLLTHRTGLAGHDLLWSSAAWPLEEGVRRAGLVPLSRGFRAAYQYNNLMYNAAGMAAGAAAGMTWRDLVTSRLLRPLGMTSTVFLSSEALAAADHASPHSRDGKPIEMYNDDDQVRPAGSLKSTANDVGRWMILHLNNGRIGGRQVLSERRVLEMRTPQFSFSNGGVEPPSAYGLGLALDNYNGELLVGHGGAVVGFRAQMAMLPKRKLGVAVLVNADQAMVQVSTLSSILDQLTGAPKKDWYSEIAHGAAEQEAASKRVRAEREARRVANTRPSLALASYAGIYDDPAYGRAWVARDGDKLYLRWSTFRLPLAHYHYDLFDVETDDYRLPNEQVQFALDGAGRAASLTFLGRTFKRSDAKTFDAAKAAARIVASVKPGADERVLIRYDATEHPLLADELARLLPSAVLYPQHLRLTQSQIDGASVYLWLPVGAGSRPYSAEERSMLAAWLDKGGARRQIHFHWADGSRKADGLNGLHTAELDAMYERALEIDYPALSAAQEKAIAALSRTTVHVRTPAGTDFFFRTGRRPFNRQNGDASAARMQSAKVRVDREIELPAGVIRVAPVEETAFGAIVLPEARFGDVVARDVRILIDNGKVTAVRASQGQAAVEAALRGSLGRFREFGLGFNPALTIGADGTIPYYGYGAGVVRMGLGDNTELGGAVTGGDVRWLFLPDATVVVDGEALVKDGKLIDRR